MKELFTIEANKRCGPIYDKAINIKQLSSNYSRLYENTKDIEKLMVRQRGVDTHKLKAIGIYFYPSVDDSPEGIINEVLAIHGRKKFWVLCSGGKDSISVVHYIATHYPEQFQGVLYINTGVGIKLTSTWLEEYCKEMGWPFEMRSPPNGTYRNIVLKVGFPNAGLHELYIASKKISSPCGLLFLQQFISHFPNFLGKSLVRLSF